VKDLKDDLLEVSREHNPELEINKIRLLAQELQQQADFVPKSLFCDQPVVEESLKKFKEVTEKLMEVKVENQITELSFKNFVTIDSKLITNEEDLNLLREWLVPENQYCRLNLLYRGSRDGMTVDAFHKKCDNHTATLTIAKSNHGKVFGGYSDQTWNVTNGQKISEKAWIFSLDEKRKFPIKPNKNTWAIATYQGCGPIFGSGPDLLISLASSEKNLAESAFMMGFKQSYSCLGIIYEYSSSQNYLYPYNRAGRFDNGTILAGTCLFDTEEIEIFSVQAIQEPNTSDFDSVIINPDQELELVKTWLGKEKQHELQLIYRASRDGFSSMDFHKNCDNVGPTLVVCKSKAYERVFGGFTSKNWSQAETYVDDPEAFLFSLSNGTKHPIIESSCAIYCSGMAGPMFGAGYDLFICPDSNVDDSSCSALGMTYQADEWLGDLSVYLGGESNFMIDEIEVFRVKSK